jgi:hypothetical protein
MQPEQETILFRLSEILGGRPPYSIGDVASIIEREGIYSWDRYGRFKRFSPDSETAQKALDLLAKLYEIRNDPQLDERYDFSDLDYELSCFCWPEYDMPDFRTQQSSQAPQPTKPAHSSSGQTKSENAYLGIILGLLKYIRGEFDGISRHPDYRSDTQLRDILDHFMSAYPGCSKSNTLKRFKTANELVPKGD